MLTEGKLYAVVAIWIYSTAVNSEYSKEREYQQATAAGHRVTYSLRRNHKIVAGLYSECVVYFLESTSHHPNIVQVLCKCVIVWLFLGRFTVMASDTWGGVPWSVCLFVGHVREPCKNGWTDRNAIWGARSGGSIVCFTVFAIQVSPQVGRRRSHKSLLAQVTNIVLGFRFFLFKILFS